MEEQVPESQAPNLQPDFQVPSPAALSGYPDFEAMKAQARELAVQQVLASKGMTSPVPVQNFQKPEIVYVRRNLTVAELIVVFAIACGIVFGIPALWNFAASRLPQIEIKVK